ncbi:MAG: immunoglobulin-like domain-containing protein, partial [Halieaceae bacterium]|nr:immunoglobulin-like domain-containing protein [Halieaceae bacterium]
EQGNNYEDPGVYIGDITVEVVINDEGVDITQLGTYTVTFTATIEDKTKVLTRTIEVIPNTTITLELDGDNPQTISIGTAWVDPGYTISNPAIQVQVDSSHLDTNTAGTYTVYYRYYQDTTLIQIERTVIVE